MRANGRLGGRDRERRVVGDPAGPFRGNAFDLRHRHERRHGAELIGPPGGQALGGEDQLARRARAEHAQESLDSARVVAEPEPGRRHREKGIVGGDPQIAARGQRSAGAHARSDDDGDGRPRDSLDQLAGVLDQIVVSARIGGAAARDLEIGDVRAGRERLVAVAADHHRTHIVTACPPPMRKRGSRATWPWRRRCAGPDCAAAAWQLPPAMSIAISPPSLISSCRLACVRASGPPPRPRTARRAPHSPPRAPRC